MKKYFTLALIIGLMTILLTGCGSSQYETQGKKNAIQYIEDKYGFEPTVTDVKSQTFSGSPMPLGSSSETGYVYVKMKHEDTIFYVFISGMSENTDGEDNYQMEVIEESIDDKVNEMLSGVVHLDYYLGNRKVSHDDAYYGMLSMKYDGDNLAEVLDGMKLNQIIVSLVDSDLSSLTEELIQEAFGTKADILFVNYKSVEDYEKAENTTYGMTSYTLSEGIDKNNAYIVEYKEF